MALPEKKAKTVHSTTWCDSFPARFREQLQPVISGRFFSLGRRRSANHIDTMLASDYDSDTEHVARECCYLVRANKSATKITSAAQYVGICRHISRVRGYIDLEGEGRIDGRLVAAGWNHCPPSQWISDGQTSGSGELSRFLVYWEAAAERPTVVGSSKNASPEDVYAMLRAGVPAWIARQLSRAGTQHLPRWLQNGQHMTWARRTQLRRIGRALSRHDDQNAIYRCGASALEVLGRLCPELQRAALHFTKIRKDATIDWSRPERPWRASDIAWDYVAQVQRDMLADQSGRVRAAWAIHEGFASKIEEITCGNRYLSF